MGNSEEAKSSVKPEKPSSPAPDQANFHVYPDWAAMQAYYGQRMPVPPYFNSAVASGHPPHPYMWGPPQPMMPPYGAPYAVYAHGGLYAHPGVPLPATPLSMDIPAKSSGNTDRGLMKKLKGFDGLAMSIGNDNNNNADSADHALSQSGTGETEGSSDGSDGNTAATGQNDGKRNLLQTGQNGGKRSREGTPKIEAGEGKKETENGPIEVKGNSEKVMGASPKVSGNVVGTVLSPGISMALELSNPSSAAKSSPTSGAVMPNEAWILNERELKRERRKQSNRESARRSRLRKQAEAEELAIKVESLTAENMTLKSEINRLTENSDKLKLENAKLMEKMKSAQVLGEEGSLIKVEGKKVVTLSTANLLSRVNSSSGPAEGGGSEMYEKNSGAKLRQLLDASPRTDAVAAG